MLNKSAIAVWLAAPLLPLGCNPTLAPLVRGAHYGAPGRLDAGQLEVGGTVGGFAPPLVGGPQLGYALRDWLTLEGGGNFQLTDGTYGWAMGYFGPRLTYTGRKHAPIRFLLDFEMGMGAGAGGTLHGNRPAPRSPDATSPPGTMTTTTTTGEACKQCDGRAWSDRLAYGAYQGVGIGGRFHLFSLFVRARIEESVARGVPLTLWPSALLGFEFDVKHLIALGGGVGYMGYFNEVDRDHGVFYQVSATLFFNVK